MTTEQPNAPQEFGDTDYIRATDLYWQLARAAQVRALVSMLSCVATLFHLAFVHFFLTEIIPVLDKNSMMAGSCWYLSWRFSVVG